MDQQICGPKDLQRRCMSSVIEQLMRTGRTDLMNNLPLPAVMIQQIDGIHQYRQDLAVLSWAPIDRVCYANIPQTPVFSDHYRWTKENDSLKINRRATAAAQLDNLDLATSSRSSKEFGFVLATAYCLEHHIRRLLPYWNPQRYCLNTNPMIGHWTADRVLGSAPHRVERDACFDIRPRSVGSSDFWLTVIQSFWPIVAEIGGHDFERWIWDVFGEALRFRHKSCLDYVWPRITVGMRKSLAWQPTWRTNQFVKSALRAEEKEILVEILAIAGFDRCAAIVYSFDEICAYYKHGTNMEMLGVLLDWMIEDHNDIFPSDIIEPLCAGLSRIWDSLTPQKRVRILNQFVDLLPCAIKFGYVDLAMSVWNEEQEQQLRQFDVLFRNECAVFRSSCANGHLELVRAFWEWASTDQRPHMIGCVDTDALRSAARNGHSSILRYLWENMDQRTAYQSVVSDGISRSSLSQLIVTESNKSDGGSHELENFLAVLITTPPDGREPIYPLAPMREMLVAALLLDEGKALNVLVQRAKDRNDPSGLRSLVGEFDNDQRFRLRSKLSMEDIEMCGLESVQIVAQPQTMAVQGGHNGEAGEDGEDEEEEEEEHGEMIDLTDEYYEG